MGPKYVITIFKYENTNLTGMNIQAVEDVFFLLHRVISRALDLSVESVVFSICNRAIELIDREAVMNGSFLKQEVSSSTGPYGGGGGGGRRSLCSFEQLQQVHIFEVLARRSFYLDIYASNVRRKHTGRDSGGGSSASDRYMTPRKHLGVHMGDTEQSAGSITQIFIFNSSYIHSCIFHSISFTV